MGGSVGEGQGPWERGHWLAGLLGEGTLGLRSLGSEGRSGLPQAPPLPSPSSSLSGEDQGP